MSTSALKKARTARGLSLRGSARKAHLSVSTIHALEHGQSHPTARTIQALREGLGLTDVEVLAILGQASRPRADADEVPA